MGKHSRDVALLTGPTEDEKGIRIVRFQDDSVTLGEVRPLTEGKPITGEVITLRTLEGAPAFVRNVETVYTPPMTYGPAQVATEAYRQNWEVIFGPKDDDEPPFSPLN